MNVDTDIEIDGDLTDMRVFLGLAGETDGPTMTVATVGGNGTDGWPITKDQASW